MTKRKYLLEFANFVCKFGNEKNLLDLVEEIVIPAFTDTELERSFGRTKHFFHQVEIVELQSDGEASLAISGRFVKDTLLAREQRFDEDNERLVSDPQQLQTSPSSIFVLLLNNHKLLYVHETLYAPSIKSFETTTKEFLRGKHSDYINRLYENRQSQAITYTSLLREYPSPQLEIVPLASEGSVTDFINQFDILQRVEINLLSTNNELDFGEFWNDARESGESINSKNTKIEYRNDTEGLLKGAVSSQIVGTASNSKIKLKGKDLQGAVLTGNNDSFKVKVLLDDLPKSINGIAKVSYQTFEDLKKHGTLKIAEISQDARSKARSLYARLRQRND